MSTLSRYWEMAQLAQASYVDLTGTAPGTVILDLQDPRPQRFYAFSKTQAEKLIGTSGFSVADRTANLNDAVGFSATKSGSSLATEHFLKNKNPRHPSFCLDRTAQRCVLHAKHIRYRLQSVGQGRAVLHCTALPPPRRLRRYRHSLAQCLFHTRLDFAHHRLQ